MKILPEHHNNIKDVILQKFDYAISTRIDLDHLYYGNIDSKAYIVDGICNNMILQINGFVWGEKGVKSKVIEYPKDWKEAFKERWFPNFLLKRFPVVYTTHEISFDLIYPNFKPNIPDEKYVTHCNIKILNSYKPYYDKFVLQKDLKEKFEQMDKKSKKKYENKATK